jgi:hypothetical protein
LARRSGWRCRSGDGDGGSGDVGKLRSPRRAFPFEIGRHVCLRALHEVFVAASHTQQRFETVVEAKVTGIWGARMPRSKGSPRF